MGGKSRFMIITNFLRWKVLSYFMNSLTEQSVFCEEVDDRVIKTAAAQIHIGNKNSTSIIVIAPLANKSLLHLYKLLNHGVTENGQRFTVITSPIENWLDPKCIQEQIGRKLKPSELWAYPKHPSDVLQLLAEELHIPFDSLIERLLSQHSPDYFPTHVEGSYLTIQQFHKNDGVIIQ